MKEFAFVGASPKKVFFSIFIKGDNSECKVLSDIGRIGCTAPYPSISRVRPNIHQLLVKAASKEIHIFIFFEFDKGNTSPASE